MDVMGFLYVSLGSSTIQLYDSLCSRCACLCSEAGLNSKNGKRAEDSTTDEQCSVVRFCGQKDSMQRKLTKKFFMFTVGSVCRVKRFTTWSRNVANAFTDDEEVETEVRNWLRQQSKDFYGTGFDALVKRRNKCINFGGGYVEK
jgi:hypothetical protein